MQLLAEFEKIMYMGFRATSNFRKFAKCLMLLAQNSNTFMSVGILLHDFYCKLLQFE